MSCTRLDAAAAAGVAVDAGGTGGRGLTIVVVVAVDGAVVDDDGAVVAVVAVVDSEDSRLTSHWSSSLVSVNDLLRYDGCMLKRSHSGSNNVSYFIFALSRPI